MKRSILLPLFMFLSFQLSGQVEQPDPDVIIVIDLPIPAIKRIATPIDEQLTAHPIDLMHYYHHENKELNLSNLLIGNVALKELESEIKTFIESIGVERLIIENAGLTTIPFNLIGFAMVCKDLRYVSFLGNNFNLFGTVESPEESRPRVDALVSEMITQTWGSLAPHIDEVLEAHNRHSEEFEYSTKQVLIDRSIPPITILDPRKKPMGKCERVKYALVRIGLFSLGVFITFVPSILPWLLTNKTNGSN